MFRAAGGVVARVLANNRFHAIAGDMAANIYLRRGFNRPLTDHACPPAKLPLRSHPDCKDPVTPVLHFVGGAAAARWWL